MNKEQESLVRVGITQGDANGIGWEVILKTFADNRMFQVCTPVVYGSTKVASFHKKALGIELNYTTLKNPDNLNTRQLNIVNVSDEEVKVELGVASEAAGKIAFKSLEAAVSDLKQNKIDVLVTAPINKKTIQAEDFKFSGHTEYLAERFQVKDNLMLMVSESLKIGTITGHVPVARIGAELSIEKIISKTRILATSLQIDFGIRKPKIAILGLNPHAGDNGLLGDEEQRIIIPAISKLKEEGLVVFGPYGADGFFGSGSYLKFDGVLAMYHDQGLIPFKALSFGSGVNFTAGLPIIRTSPDHGTGFEIAGKNIASESSMREAIYLAIDSFKKRQENSELTVNPLRINVMKKERG